MTTGPQASTYWTSSTRLYQVSSSLPVDSSEGEYKMAPSQLVISKLGVQATVSGDTVTGLLCLKVSRVGCYSADRSSHGGCKSGLRSNGYGSIVEVSVLKIQADDRSQYRAKGKVARYRAMGCSTVSRFDANQRRRCHGLGPRIIGRSGHDAGRVLAGKSLAAVRTGSMDGRGGRTRLGGSEVWGRRDFYTSKRHGWMCTSKLVESEAEWGRVGRSVW